MAEVADDLSDIRAYNSRRGPRCSVAVLMNSAPPLIADKVQRALEDPSLQTKAISRWLNDQGYEMSHWQMQYHRRGDCSCG